MKMPHRISLLAMLLSAAVCAQTPSTTYTYDANGNLTARTDLLSHTTSNQYDSLNRLIRITDPAAGQAHFGYNGQGAQTQVTDPRSLITSYTIDGLGNKTQLVSPDTGTSSATYDAAGNVLTRTDAKGQITQYLYDALNRPTRATYHDGSKDEYTWDQGTNGKGRLTQIDQKNPAGTIVLTIQYGYDALGRKIQESRQLAGQTYNTQYQYSSTGRLNRLTYPSGRKIDYGYNAQGQVTSLTLTDTSNNVTVLASNIQYHPFGGVKTLLNGAGETLTFGVDLNGRPSTYSLSGQLWQVGYDDANRITGQVNTANVAQAGSYTYDTLDRLTQASLPGITHGYGYDATGNRTSQTSGSSNRTYATSATNNRLTGITGSNPKTYSYDNNGSTTGDGAITYSYDIRGRMISSTGALGTTNYTIDPVGQRVRKANSTEDTVFHYDAAGHIIATSTAAGVAQEDFVWLDDKPISVIGSSVSYIHSDHLNTPRVVTDSSNVAVWRNLPTTEPFGDAVPEEDPNNTGTNFKFNLRFPGQYFDKETGLSYNYFRDYNPSTGRYVQSDPIGLDGGINTYAYVESSPVQYIDPNGHARHGGKTGKWWEFTDRNFQRWFHHCVKSPGDADASREELADAYAEWIKNGKPDGKNGCGGPPTPPVPAEVCGEDCKKTATVVVAGGTAYVVYRCLRLLPSLLPPLWPTIPANVAVP